MENVTHIKRSPAIGTSVTIDDLRLFVQAYDDSERDHRDKFMRTNDAQLQTLKAQLPGADDARTDQLVDAIREALKRRSALHDDIHRAVLSGMSTNAPAADAEILKLLRSRASKVR
jgi:hypothetical protein